MKTYSFQARHICLGCKYKDKCKAKEKYGMKCIECDEFEKDEKVHQGFS